MIIYTRQLFDLTERERETNHSLSNLVYRANERGFYPRVKRIRTPTTTPQPPPDNTREEGPGKDGQDKDGLGKGLVEVPQPSGGCPYFFYYNTRYPGTQEQLQRRTRLIEVKMN